LQVKVQLPKDLEKIVLPWRSGEKPDLREVLSNKDLAALGDSYLNFLYSVSLSLKLGRPVGGRIKGSILCSALKETGLRKLLPRRVDRHSQANAVEALAAYTWIEGLLSFRKALKILSMYEDSTIGITKLALRMREAFEKWRESYASQDETG